MPKLQASYFSIHYRRIYIYINSMESNMREFNELSDFGAKMNERFYLMISDSNCSKRRYISDDV